MDEPVNLYFIATIVCASVSGMFIPRLGFMLLAAFVLFDVIAGRYA